MGTLTRSVAAASASLMVVFSMAGFASNQAGAQAPFAATGIDAAGGNYIVDQSRNRHAGPIAAARTFSRALADMLDLYSISPHSVTFISKVKTRHRLRAWVSRCL